MSCTSLDFVQNNCTCYNLNNAKIQVITCTKYCLKMALTCTIYENNFNLKIKNNFKSEVMKSNDQKEKKHNIQHA